MGLRCREQRPILVRSGANELKWNMIYSYSFPYIEYSIINSAKLVIYIAQRTQFMRYLRNIGGSSIQRALVFFSHALVFFSHTQRNCHPSPTLHRNDNDNGKDDAIINILHIVSRMLRRLYVCETSLHSKGTVT